MESEIELEKLQGKIVRCRQCPRLMIYLQKLSEHKPGDSKIGPIIPSPSQVSEIRMPGFLSLAWLLQPMAETGQGECLPGIEAESGSLKPSILFVLPITPIRSGGMMILP